MRSLFIGKGIRQSDNDIDIDINPQNVGTSNTGCLPYSLGTPPYPIRVIGTQITLNDPVTPGNIWNAEVWWRGEMIFKQSLVHGQSKDVFIYKDYDYNAGATSEPFQATAVKLAGFGDPTLTLTALPKTFKVPEACERIELTCEVLEFIGEDIVTFDGTYMQPPFRVNIVSFEFAGNYPPYNVGGQSSFSFYVPNLPEYSNAGQALTCYYVLVEEVTPEPTTTCRGEYTCEDIGEGWQSSSCEGYPDIPSQPQTAPEGWCNAYYNFNCYYCPPVPSTTKDPNLYTCEDANPNYTSYETAGCNRVVYVDVPQYSNNITYTNYPGPIICYDCSLSTTLRPYTCADAGKFTTNLQGVYTFNNAVPIPQGFQGYPGNISCFEERNFTCRDLGDNYYQSQPPGNSRPLTWEVNDPYFLNYGDVIYCFEDLDAIS